MPSPDPSITMPAMLVSLQGVGGGTLFSGPRDLSSPGSVYSLDCYDGILNTLYGIDANAVFHAWFNVRMESFFTLVEQLNLNSTRADLNMKVTLGNLDPHRVSETFFLLRTFDGFGDPIGFVVAPKTKADRLRAGRNSTTENWLVSVVDNGSSDRDWRQGFVEPQIATVVAIVSTDVSGTVTPTPTTASGEGPGGGCSLGFVPSLGILLAPLLLLVRR